VPLKERCLISRRHSANEIFRAIALGDQEVAHPSAAMRGQTIPGQQQRSAQVQCGTREPPAHASDPAPCIGAPPPTNAAADQRGPLASRPGVRPVALEGFPHDPVKSTVDMCLTMPATVGHKEATSMLNESESDQRWALVGLLLWTPVVRGAIAGVVYLVGRWMFRIW